MATRKMVRIDEAKCDGCGECVTSCAEGAIAVIDGKARLVSEIYCDGLGACLGHCPQDAITIEEREAAAFDEGETQKHLARMQGAHRAAAPIPMMDTPHQCPGSADGERREDPEGQQRQPDPRAGPAVVSGRRSDNCVRRGRRHRGSQGNRSS